MMGAGKTAVAEALAGTLGWRAVDTDHLVEQHARMTVAELFAAEGEEAFREAEAAAIGSLAGVPGPLVVSVGGGAVTRAANRELMRKLGAVVWLRAAPATLASRVGSGEGRPLLGAGGTGAGSSGAGGAQVTAARLVELAEQRRPFYEEVANLIVDTDELSPGEVAATIVGKLGLASAR